jgi:hypothetical protein
MLSKITLALNDAKLRRVGKLRRSDGWISATPARRPCAWR